MNIIDNIREIRLQKGITQEAIADALNVDTSVVSNIEKGKRELRVSELEKVANVLEVETIYLLTYPKKYVDSSFINDKSAAQSKVSITFEVAPEKHQMLIDLLTESNPNG